MPKLINLRWIPGNLTGLPRTERGGCEYTAYVPDKLENREFPLSAETVADIVDAERAIGRLNHEGGALVKSEVMARMLLRAESVASSRIEGLEVGGRRLLKADLAHQAGMDATDMTAAEVLGNIEAMRWAVEILSSVDEIRVEHILEVHRKLLTGTRMEKYAGRIREQQNWIGGNAFNPCAAVFVPPPPEEVQALLEDLCRFCNEDRLPAVAQAAIVHSQFETIHPFVDGNGRTGRALIHVILRRRGIAPRALPPISLVLATWTQAYVDGLNSTRFEASPTSLAAADATDRWISFFASATNRSVDDAEEFERRVSQVQDSWRSRLGRFRRGSAVDELIASLPEAPILTAKTAAALINRSEQAVNNAIPRLTETGILKQTSIGRRNRAFEATELIDAFNDLERQLASPDGDTRYSDPSRPVPYRRPEA